MEPEKGMRKDEDKVLIAQNSANAVKTNSSVDALTEVQKTFQGVAGELGIETEQDVVEMVRQIRTERRSHTNPLCVGSHNSRIRFFR